MENYILRTLKKKKECAIATFDGKFIDNATISFYSEDYKIYFGSYDFTTKCKFIKSINLVALATDRVQIHGRCIKICKNSLEYKRILNKYLEKFIEKGLVPSGVNPETNLVEIIELKDHPFYIGVQFHPELKSTVMNPHPLFVSFIKAAIDYKNTVV